MPAPDVEWPGVWWLPEHPDRQVRGTAHFGTRQQLEVSEQFEPPPPLAVKPSGVVIVDATLEPRDYPVLFGEVDGIGAVTLAEVGGLFANVPANQPWSFRYAIQGARVQEADLKFNNLLFTTDHLWDWATPTHIRPQKNDGALVLHFPESRLFESVDDGVEIRLFTRATARISSPKASAELVAMWEIRLTEPVSIFEAIDRWLGPLRDLVSFLSGSPNRFTWIAAGGPGWNHPLDLHMWLLGDSLPPSDDSISTRDQLFPLALVKDAPRAVRDWLSQREDLRQVLARLLSSAYAPFVFEDHRVTNIAQAAEGLHKQLWDHPSLDPSEHRTRVEAAINPDTPKQTRDWAMGVLSNANQLSLRVRVLELVGFAVEAGLPMAPADASAFALEVSNGRNRPSHGGGLVRGGDLDRLYRTFQALEWILKALLLSRIGVATIDVADRFAHDGNFATVASQLGWQPVPRSLTKGPIDQSNSDET